MDYTALRIIAKETLWNELAGIFSSRKCPICNEECSMIKVIVEDKEKWRCLNCLTLFTEELKETI